MRFYKVIIIISLVIIATGGIKILLMYWSPRLLFEWKIEGISKEALKDFEIDSDGLVYIAIKNKIKVFSEEGEFLREVGKEGNLMTYALESTFHYRKVGGEVKGEFIGLSSLVVDEAGYIYASDSLLNIVEKFDNKGKFIKKWGRAGRGEKEFFGRLIGIAGTDSEGNTYTIDTEKILKFDSEGNHLSTIIIEKLREGGSLVKVDFAGRIYIFSLLENKIFNYENENLVKTIDLSGIGIVYDIDIDKKGNIYLLTNKGTILKVKEAKGKTKRIKLKTEKIPFFLRVNTEKERIYLISTKPSTFPWEEGQEFYVQIYRLPKRMVFK